MDIDALHAFVEVAEQGSFSLAAETLHLTQPAVSKRISTLEDTLGLRLFDRLGRRVTLTEAGRALAPRARRLLLDLEDTRRAMAALDERVVGSLPIATSHHIGLHRLPSALRHFTQRYPDVRLDIRFIDSEDAFDAVAQGRIELGIITLPPSLPPRFRAIPVWHDPMNVVVCPDHPLAKDTRISLKQLASHAAILPSSNTFTRRIVQSLFQSARADINVAIETNYLETIRMMVSIGLGWSVLPASMLSDELMVLDVPRLQLSRTLGIVCHEEHSLSNAARAMIESLTLFGSPECQKLG
jgi:DNA-binding transcriptional LysR family regulator